MSLVSRLHQWARASHTRLRQARPVDVLVDLAVVAGGVVFGLVAAFVLLAIRARADVVAYLADPPRPPSSVVWSAPMRARAGQHVDVEAFTADLIAAGLDRADGAAASRPGEFAVSSGGGKDVFDIRVADGAGPAGPVKGGTFAVEVRAGRVVRTTPPTGVVLPPTVLGTLGDPETRRSPVRLAEISPWLEPALLAMEDARFRSHAGIDPIGILRALATDLTRQEVQGGSTLTQQLAKNLLLSSERTIRRKIREFFVAAALESQLSKDELLELYLSEIYLGQMSGMPVYGVETAARAWFGVSSSKLDLAQAAALVGVIPAPNAWSPVRNPEAALERRNLVLRKLLTDGKISQAEHDAAVAQPLTLRGIPPSRLRRAPYAVDLAADVAERALPPGAFAAGGYALVTSIDPILQRAAEEALTDGMAELEASDPDLADIQAALVAVRVADGAVVALVGGRSYAKSPFNRAEAAHRQVGSTVKPLTMLAAFDRGVANPATVLDDRPIVRADWEPRNYDGTFRGPVSLREAIEDSRNIPAILLSERVGHADLAEFLRAAGLPDATALPSAALGSFPATPMELAGAYTAFDRGIASRPRVLSSISGPSGALVRTFDAEQIEVASPEAAAVAVNVLEGVITSGTGTRARAWGVGPPAAGKTGTTDEYRDAWFVGLTREYAIAVWVGRDEGILGLSGAKAALPTWARFVAATAMSKATRTMPDGVVSALVCGESGGLARPSCPYQHSDWFVGTAMPTECDEHGGLFRPGSFLGDLFRRRPRDDDDRPAPTRRNKPFQKPSGRQ